MTEWLRIMLDEIERRRRAEREAQQEHERRQLERNTRASAGESVAAQSPGRHS